MLPFEDRINEELKEAMRAKNQVKLDTLRAMKSALKYKFVEKKQEPLSEGEALQVLQTLIKQRKDSIDQFEANGRGDAAVKEREEIAVIQSFLPQALSETELKAMVDEAVKRLGASSPKDMGLVMKDLTPKTTGRADGKVLSDLVKQRLSS